MSGFNVSGIITLRDAFSATAARVGASAQALKGQLAGVQAQGAAMGAAAGKGGGFFGLTGVATAAIAGLTALAYGVGKSISAFSAFEDEMASVRKTSNATTTEIGALSAEIIEISKNSRTAATDLAKMMAIGAQAGIAKDQLGSFTRFSEMASVAGDMTPEAVATYITNLMKSQGMGIDGAKKVVDVLNNLSNKSGSSMAQLLESMQRSGAIAKAQGVSATSLAAASAFQIEGGRPPESVGRGYNAIFGILATASTLPQEALDSFAKMGLDPIKLQAEAAVNGMNALLNVVKRIGELPAVDANLAINNIFGREWGPMGQFIAANLPRFMELQKLATQDASGSVLEEYSLKMDTLSAKTDVLVNKLSALMIRLGSALSPFAEGLVQALTGIVEAADWVLTKLGAISDFMKNIGSSVGGFFSSIYESASFTNAPGPTQAIQTANQDFVSGRTNNMPQTVNVEVSGGVEVRQDGRTIGRAPVTKVGTNGAGRASTGGDVGITSYGY